MWTHFLCKQASLVCFCCINAVSFFYLSKQYLSPLYSSKQCVITTCNLHLTIVNLLHLCRNAMYTWCVLFLTIIWRNSSRGFFHLQGAGHWEHHRRSWPHSTDCSLQFPAQQTCRSCAQVCVSTQPCYTLCTGPGKPGKSWCIEFVFIIEFLFRSWILFWKICIQKT